MPVVGKRVELSDALEDSPQTQGIIEDMETTVNPLKEFTSQLKDAFQTLHTNQVRVSESLKTVGTVLESVNEKSFGEKDPFMAEAMKQLGKYVSELQTWQEMLCTQLDTALVQQLDTFVSNDMTKLTSLRDAFNAARTEHNQSMAKYSRVSKKKETERSRFDANSELFSSRRRFHQSSLQYYAELNSFSFKKKFAVLDPLLAFMHSQLAYFKMGHEILTDEVGKFLTSLNVEIQKVRSEHEQTMRQQMKVANQLEQLSPQLCIPDPDPSDPFVEYQPANLHLAKNSGYLFLKTGNKTWERIYFFTKDHLLYSQMQQKAAVVFLDLTAAGVDASSADIDDKRYAFHIMTVKHFTDDNGQAFLQKKPFHFQAESAKSRDEWVATVINIVSKRRQSQNPAGRAILPQTRERSDSDIVRQERERIRSFVQSVSGSTLPSPVRAQPSNNPPTSQKLPNLPPPQKRLQQMPPARQQHRPRPPPPARGSGTVQQILEMAESTNFQGMKGEGYLKSYVVRYLGTLEVQQKAGVGVVKDTIRRIIAARALKNLMTVYTVNMIVTHKHVSLQDQVSKKITTQFKLKDISYCAKHPDNEKLFGVIARVYRNNTEKHVCYVFEAEGMHSGKNICQSIIEAIKVAVKMITGTPGLPQAQDEPVPSFDLPSSVFNAPATGDKMSKSLSTGSFEGGALKFPEDEKEAAGKKSPLNESFNEDDERLLVDVLTEVPPTEAAIMDQTASGYPTDHVYSVPTVGKATPTVPPPSAVGDDLLDLTTPTTNPNAGTMGDLMGLDDLQTATNEALSTGSSNNPGPQTTPDPFNNGSRISPDPFEAGSSSNNGSEITPDPFGNEPHYEYLPASQDPPQHAQTMPVTPNPFDS